jgi:hypothetical protein
MLLCWRFFEACVTVLWTALLLARLDARFLRSEGASHAPDKSGLGTITI